MMVHEGIGDFEIKYRGYTIVYGNGVGCYVWHGSEHIESIYGPNNETMVKRAREIVDEYLNGDA